MTAKEFYWRAALEADIAAWQIHTWRESPDEAWVWVARAEHRDGGELARATAPTETLALIRLGQELAYRAHDAERELAHALRPYPRTDLRTTGGGDNA